MSSTAKKKHAENIPSKVAHGIRELISRGTLGPGVHLGQAELAQQFATSRVPIREALKLLVSEGLIQHDVNRGFFVASVSKDDAMQLYRVRYLLEHELLQTIPWPTPPQLNDLRTRLAELDRLLTLGKRSEWAARRREFHRTLFELSEQKVLVREVLRLGTSTDRYRSLLPPPSGEDTGKSTERALLDALAKRDRKGLLRIFEADRAKVEAMLVNALHAREN